MKINVAILALTAISLSACVGNAPPPAGQSGVSGISDLAAFQGARAGKAEIGITRLGYEPIRTQGLTQYWFNRSTGACAELTVSDGRYESATMRPTDEC